MTLKQKLDKLATINLTIQSLINEDKITLKETEELYKQLRICSAKLSVLNTYQKELEIELDKLYEKIDG